MVDDLFVVLTSTGFSFWKSSTMRERAKEQDAELFNVIENTEHKLMKKKKKKKNQKSDDVEPVIIIPPESVVIEPTVSVMELSLNTFDYFSLTSYFLVGFTQETVGIDSSEDWPDCKNINIQLYEAAIDTGLSIWSLEWETAIEYSSAIFYTLDSMVEECYLSKDQF